MFSDLVKGHSKVVRSESKNEAQNKKKDKGHTKDYFKMPNSDE